MGKILTLIGLSAVFCAHNSISKTTETQEEPPEPILGIHLGKSMTRAGYMHNEAGTLLLVGDDHDVDVFATFHRDYEDADVWWWNRRSGDTSQEHNGNFNAEDSLYQLFGRIKRRAVEALHENFTSAVVTVPQHFDDEQRRTIKDAGWRAGLAIMRIINEPTASVIASGLREADNEERYALIIIANVPDLVEAHIINIDYGVIMIEESMIFNLTETSEEKLPVAIHDFVNHTLGDPDLVQFYGFQPPINDVMAVGDAFSYEMTKKILLEIPHTNYRRAYTPALVVVRGVAMQADVLSKYKESDDNCWHCYGDVNGLSLGVQTAQGAMRPVIEKNTVIPTRKSLNFTTSMDNQRTAVIGVYAGERPLAAQNRFLASFSLRDLTPRPRGELNIEITFVVDVNGFLHVSAEETSSGRRTSTTPDYYLSIDEIDAARDEAEELEEEDMKTWKRLPLSPNALPASAQTAIWRTVAEFGVW